MTGSSGQCGLTLTHWTLPGGKEKDWERGRLTQANSLVWLRTSSPAGGPLLGEPGGLQLIAFIGRAVWALEDSQDTQGRVYDRSPTLALTVNKLVTWKPSHLIERQG